MKYSLTNNQNNDRTDICLNKKAKNNDPPTVVGHWLNIFDILFRGTNIKLSK